MGRRGRGEGRPPIHIPGYSTGDKTFLSSAKPYRSVAVIGHKPIGANCGSLNCIALSFALVTVIVKVEFRIPAQSLGFLAVGILLSGSQFSHIDENDV